MPESTAADQPPRVSLFKVISHQSLPLIPWALIGLGLYNLTFKDSVLAAIGAVVGAAIYMLLIVGLLSHAGVVCDLCREEWPLNGAELAERASRWLKLYHWLFGPHIHIWRIGISYRWISLMVGPIIFSEILQHVFGVSYSAIEVIDFFILTLPVATGMYSLYKHSRLYDFCPQCHPRDGGGGRIEMPTPDPSTSRT